MMDQYENRGIGGRLEVARYPLNKGSVLTSFIPIMVFIMMMTSSYVFVEPAPVDVLTLGIALLLFMVGLRVPRGFMLPLFFLGLFALGNLMAIPMSPSTEDASIYAAVTIYLLIALIMYASLMYWDYQRLMPYFWKGYIVAACIAGVAAIIGFFGLLPGSDIFVTNDRASATFKDPNVYGPFLVAVILYFINGFEDQKTSGRLVYAGLSLFLMLALFISFSRGAIGNFLLALFVMLVIKIALKNSMRTFSRYLLGGTIIVSMVMAALVVGIMTSERLQTMVEVRGKVVHEYDVNEGGRFNTQLQAIHFASEHPLGAGPGDSDVVLGLEPHNVYLLVLVETGVIGFVGWVGFFGLTVYRSGTFFRRSLFIPKDFLPIYAAFIGTIVESFIIDSIHWRHLFVLSGVLWGIMLATRQQQIAWLSVNEETNQGQLKQQLMENG